MVLEIQSDISGATITVGSIFLIIGIVLTILSFAKSSKKDIQVKATDYAILKAKVETHEETIVELKQDLREQRNEWKSELTKLDEQLMSKVNTIDGKLDDLMKLLIKK